MAPPVESSRSMARSDQALSSGVSKIGKAAAPAQIQAGRLSSRIWAISVGARRVLMGVATAPIQNPAWISVAWRREFAARMANRSPGLRPNATSAPASRETSSQCVAQWICLPSSVKNAGRCAKCWRARISADTRVSMFRSVFCERQNTVWSQKIDRVQHIHGRPVL